MKKLILLIFIFIIIISATACRSKNERITVSGLKDNFNSDPLAKFRVTVNNESEYDNAENISAMLCLDEWANTHTRQGEDIRIVIEISEEYEIRIYDSYIQVYDGYALIGQAKSEYYAISQTMEGNITEYMANLETKNII